MVVSSKKIICSGKHYQVLKFFQSFLKQVANKHGVAKGSFMGER